MVEFMLGKAGDLLFYNMATNQITDVKDNACISIMDALKEYLPNDKLLLYINPPKFMDVRKKLTDFLNTHENYNRMTISFITNPGGPGTIKKGARRIHKVGTNMDDIYFDKALNTDEHVIEVKSSYMRLQQETYLENGRRI